MDLCIIFDLDGTLWDSTGCACDIWNRVLEKHNNISFRMTKEKAEQLMGKTMEDIGLILFPELPTDARNAISSGFFACAQIGSVFCGYRNVRTYRA